MTEFSFVSGKLFIIYITVHPEETQQPPDTITTVVVSEFQISQAIRRYSNFSINYFKVDFPVNVSVTLLISPLHYH
jgi:hypothetical protein